MLPLCYQCSMSTFRLEGRTPLLSAHEPALHWPLSTFDLGDLEWATPFDIAALALLWSRLQREQSLPDIVLPRDPQVRAYLVDIGLDAVIEGTWGGGGGSLVEPPLVRLTHLLSGDAWDDVLGVLWPSVRAVLGEYTVAMRTLEIMSELVDNAVTHGRSALGTWVCAQRYTGATSGQQQGIWVGIADGGIGIPDHLRGNPKYTGIRADEKLIRLARRPWVTGTADQRGWGLKEVFDDAAATGPSDVLIRSGRGEGQFRLRQQTRPYARYRHLKHAVPGTWVHVRIAAA